jgi:hypothetical protein
MSGNFAEAVSNFACKGAVWEFDDATFIYSGGSGGTSMSGLWRVANGTL